MSTQISEDTLLLCAKAVFDNYEDLGFENEEFKPESVRDCADTISGLLQQEKMGLSWIEGIAEAQSKGQPILVMHSKDGTWNYLTMASGTRRDILRQLAKVDFDKAKNGKDPFKKKKLW